MRHVLLSFLLLTGAACHSEPRLPLAQFTPTGWDEGWLIAEGPLVMGAQESAYDQTIYAYCDRGRATCVIAYARLVPGSSRTDPATLRADMETYDIKRWTDEEIVSEPYEYVCASYVLRAERRAESFTLTRTTTPEKEGCEGAERRAHRLAPRTPVRARGAVARARNALHAGPLRATPEH